MSVSVLVCVLILAHKSSSFTTDSSSLLVVQLWFVKFSEVNLNICRISRLFLWWEQTQAQLNYHCSDKVNTHAHTVTNTHTRMQTHSRPMSQKYLSVLMSSELFNKLVIIIMTTQTRSCPDRVCVQTNIFFLSFFLSKLCCIATQLTSYTCITWQISGSCRK